MRRVIHREDLRAEAAPSPAVTTVVSGVCEVVDLRAESADDVQSDRMVHVAEGQVSSKYTMSSEVETDSDFRLAWLFVEGWRAKIRKAGDVVEKARWEWRVDDLLAKNKERRESIPEIVTKVPSVLKRSNRNVVSQGRSGSQKSQRVWWPDDGSTSERMGNR